MIYLLPLVNIFFYFKLLVVLTSVELVFSVFVDVSVLPFNILASQMVISIIKYCFFYIVSESLQFDFSESVFKHIRNQLIIINVTALEEQ